MIRMLTDDVAVPLETWCVYTEDGCRYVLDCAGNGGFGPVNVWSNGLLVPVVYRHLFQRDNVDCPVCVAPMQANTYLPSIRWDTADPARTATPGSGDPDRGAFEAVFRGGPDYDRMWAEVFRRDWWRHWCDYAVVDLDPRGDWQSAFDNWRRLATGYQLESSGSAAEGAATEWSKRSVDDCRPSACRAARAARRRPDQRAIDRTAYLHHSAATEICPAMDAITESS